jgi:hypothetical protein
MRSRLGQRKLLLDSEPRKRARLDRVTGYCPQILQLLVVYDSLLRSPTVPYGAVSARQGDRQEETAHVRVAGMTDFEHEVRAGVRG